MPNIMRFLKRDKPAEERVDSESLKPDFLADKSNTLEVSAPLDEAEASPSKPAHKSYQKKEEVMNQILEVLKSTEGQVVTNQSLSDLMGYKNQGIISRYILQLIKKGAVIRGGTRKAPVYVVKTTRVNKVRKSPSSQPLTEGMQKVFDYLSANQNRPVKRPEIYGGAGVPKNTVGWYVSELERRGLIVRTKINRYESSYRIRGESRTPGLKQGPNLQEEDAAKAEAMNEQTLYNVIESLSWEYMKEHWDANLLKFLSWLKTMKLKK